MRTILLTITALSIMISSYFVLPAQADGPAGVLELFVTDRQDYAASANIVIEKKDESGIFRDVTSQISIVQGNLLFNTVRPECSGNIKLAFQPGDYKISWVAENNLYPTNPEIVVTNGFSFPSTVITFPNNEIPILTAHMKVDPIDSDQNGTVSNDEYLYSRNWFDQNCSGTPFYYGTPTPTPTLSPTATPTQAPTSTPTPTPTPTPAAVSFDQIGLKPIGPVEVTVQQGVTSNVYVGVAESVTATQFANYGYPTSYGPGISMNPSTAGMIPGSKTNLSVYVNANVPLGTYSGFQRVTTNVAGLYSQYPVTVHVVVSAPTPTPTMTMTPTPTPAPALSLSQVQAVNVTKSSAKIIWTTNVPATSQVVYGASTRSMTQTPEDSVMKTSHSINLAGLSAGKTYNYYVISKDQKGVSKISATLKFTTPRK